MKSRLLNSLLAVLLLAQITPCQSPSKARNKPVQQTATVPLETRIRNVENGLLPAVLVKGDSGWSIQDRMKHYKAPAVSIAVINNFKVEWAKAYGVKDIETNEPAATDTLFQAGSISKPVAAMVALKKVAEGKISLEENINDKLVSWKLPDNEFTARKKVTLAHLLSHTGGLTVHGFPGYAPGERIPTLPQVLDGAPPTNTAPVRVDFEPGTKFRYSGGGVTIAQLAIMDIEKKPYPQIASETVLGPLKMTNSTYAQPLPDEIRPKAASGHRPNGKPVNGKIHIYPEMAAAGLWTTPTDLAKFAIEVQLSLAGKSNKVLSKEMIAKMVTPFIPDSAAGLGFFVEKHGSTIYFGHNGADEGFRATLLVHKEKGYGAVIMVNSDNDQIMAEILRSVANEYQWDEYLPKPNAVVSVDTAKLDEYTGRFLVSPDRVLTVTREGGKVFGEPTLSPRFELLPISETGFIRRDQDVSYIFLRGAGGKFESIQIRFEGRASIASRMAPDAKIPYEKLAAGQISEAIEAYRTIKKQKPANAAVEEERLNSIGYSFLEEKKFEEAIAILKLNAELYPSSSNVYDSLGEAYMIKGDKELAVANYKKSLDLDPHNENAINMIKKLTQ